MDPEANNYVSKFQCDGLVFFGFELTCAGSISLKLMAINSCNLQLLLKSRELWGNGYLYFFSDLIRKLLSIMCICNIVCRLPWLHICRWNLLTVRTVIYIMPVLVLIVMPLVKTIITWPINRRISIGRDDTRQNKTYNYYIPADIDFPHVFGLVNFFLKKANIRNIDHWFHDLVNQILCFCYKFIVE